MKRKIIKIDEEKCTGCGLCIPSCKEGALKIVDGKVRLVKDSYCDGLGACLGECPFGALTIVEREAEQFDEKAVHSSPTLPCGCPGSMAKSIERSEEKVSEYTRQKSELRQWPIQLHLIPPTAPYLKNADFLLMADCTAVAYANIHPDYIRKKIVAMACPKLDNTEPYLEKLTQMFKFNDIKSITVMMMEVPCCKGLGELVKRAVELSKKNVKIENVFITIEGEIL